MKLLIIIFLITNIAYAADFKLNILPKQLVKNNKLSNFINTFGKPVSNYKNLYEFKSKDVNIIAYTDKNKKVYRAEFKYYKSPITYNTLRKLLTKFNKIIINGHSSGRKLSFTKDDETVQFNNNSKQNLNSYEVKWRN